jgi:hypothetical protein
LGNLQDAAAVDVFPAFRGRLCRRKRRKEEVNSMTMVKRDSNSIWSLVREDRDIDDLIFAGETLNGREMSQPCSDR